MRRHDEPIEVRLGRVDDEEGPGQFLWRNRIWRVLGVQSHWIEAGTWWDQPRVRAARGDWHGPLDDQEDLLCEREVWRVEAANGQFGSRGIYDLAHFQADGSWQLRAVLD